MEELNKYLTEVEKEQLNTILAKAMERREEDGGGAAEDGCQFLFTQCGKKTEEEGKVVLEVSCKAGFKNLIKEICDCCPRGKDEDLPFR